ncbi:hypothetical protein E4U53_000035, partial [Claviceps sorghi]
MDAHAVQGPRAKGQDASRRIQDPGARTQDSGPRTLDPGLKIQDPSLRQGTDRRRGSQELRLDELGGRESTTKKPEPADGKLSSGQTGKGQMPCFMCGFCAGRAMAIRRPIALASGRHFRSVFPVCNECAT